MEHAAAQRALCVGVGRVGDGAWQLPFQSAYPMPNAIKVWSWILEKKRMQRAVAAICAGLFGCASAPASGPVLVAKGGTYPTASTKVINAPDINGAFLITKSTSNLRFRPVTVLNAYRAIETAPGVRVDNMTSIGLNARNLGRDGIRLREAHNVTIRDFDLVHGPTPSVGKHLPEGIAIGAGRGITISNGRVRGFRMTQHKGNYTNGDGIATEGAVDGLLIENVVASDNSDAGFDIKGRNVVLRNLEAVDNGRAFRIWSPTARATLLRARNFKGAALWVGKDAAITVERLVASSMNPAPVFRYESGATIIVKSCDLSGMPKGSKLVQADGKGAKLDLGPGCRL